jgi:DNA helicase-2/ATP-dependent DNA helicase PcrA
VLWLTEGSFPNARAMESTDGEEEERRLFYVAVTRAKDELYLIHPQLKMTGGYGEAFQTPSRFLQEIPAKFYQKLEFDVGYA